MSDRPSADYPGHLASATDVRALADEYRRAAAILATAVRPGQPLSRWPYRLLVIQAVELYLNAFLLERGLGPADVRRLGHDVGARAELAVAAGLSLRVRTRSHLRALCERREYLVSRYAPDRKAELSHLNRLEATVEEVARKTAAPRVVASAR